MIIRNFTESDRETLRNIYLVSRKQTFTWFDTSGYTLVDFDNDTQGEQIMVADKEGAVIGFVSCWQPDDFIHHLFVHPAYVGLGVGKALLSAAAATLNKPVALKCLTRNEYALAFYRSHGWQIEEKGEGKPGEYFLMSYGE